MLNRREAWRRVTEENLSEHAAQAGVPAARAAHRPYRPSPGPRRGWTPAWAALLLLLIGGLGTPVHAWDEGDTLHLQFGVYQHYGSDDDYEGPPILFNVEWNRASNWLYGLSLFNNSFGQFSQYLYTGKKWELPNIHEHLHVKLTGGVIHGYKDEFEDKLAYNNSGFAPAIIPSVGMKKGRWAADLVLLGDAALMFAIGYDVR